MRSARLSFEGSAPASGLSPFFRNAAAAVSLRYAHRAGRPDQAIGQHRETGASRLRAAAQRGKATDPN